jgi:hypothetical protein
MTSASAYAYDGYPPREQPQVLIYGGGREIASREDANVQQAYAAILMFLCFVPGGFVHVGIRE